MIGGPGSGRKGPNSAADKSLMKRLRNAGKNDPAPKSIADNAKKAFRDRKKSS